MKFSGSWAQYSFTGVQKLKIFPPTIMNLYRKAFTLYTYFTHLLYTIHFFEHLNNCTSVLDGHRCIKQGISNLKYFQRPGRHTAHAKNIMLLSGNLALGTGVQGNVVTHQVGRHLPAGDLEFWRLILVLGCLKTD